MPTWKESRCQRRSWCYRSGWTHILDRRVKSILQALHLVRHNVVDGVEDAVSLAKAETFLESADVLYSRVESILDALDLVGYNFVNGVKQSSSSEAETFLKSPDILHRRV